MKQHIALIAAVLIILGLTAVGIPSRASALNGSSGNLCAGKGDGFCLDDFHGTIATEPYQNGDKYQLVQTTPEAGCPNHGTKVSSANQCPFTPGSGLNSQYNGDKIVFVEVYDRCIAGNGVSGPSQTGTAITKACPNDVSGDSSGTMFVEDGDYALVNVTDSDATSDHSGRYLCSVGAQSIPPSLRSFQSGYCQWAFKNQ